MPETVQGAPAASASNAPNASNASNPPNADPALHAFLTPISQPVALRLRMLANAWQAGGGTLQVGRLAVRLLARGRDGRPFTAGTLHPGQEGSPARLELARVLLQGHGVDEAAWSDWCDERPELRPLGFSGIAKFPIVHLDAIADPALARLALGLRDLARRVASGSAARQDAPSAGTDRQA